MSNAQGYRCNACGVNVNNLKKHEQTAKHLKMVSNTSQPVRTSRIAQVQQPAQQQAPEPAPARRPVKAAAKKSPPPKRNPAPVEEEYEEEYDERSSYTDDEGEDEQKKMSGKELANFEREMGASIVDLLNTDPKDYNDEDYKLLDFLQKNIMNKCNIKPKQ